MEELKDLKISVVMGGKEYYNEDTPFFVELLTDEITLKTKLTNKKELVIKFTKQELNEKSNNI